VSRVRRDNYGDFFRVTINFMHLKGQEFVIANTKINLTRTFDSNVKELYLDLPLFTLSYAHCLGYLKKDLSDMYTNKEVIIKWKPEVLQLPVFCKCDEGGYVEVINQHNPLTYDCFYVGTIV
jgi:hypothetical protein